MGGKETGVGASLPSCAVAGAVGLKVETGDLSGGGPVDPLGGHYMGASPPSPPGGLWGTWRGVFGGLPWGGRGEVVQATPAPSSSAGIRTGVVGPQWRAELGGSGNTWCPADVRGQLGCLGRNGSKEVQSRQNIFLAVKRKLRQMGVSYSMPYLSQLWVVSQGTTLFFKTPYAMWAWIEAQPTRPPPQRTQDPQKRQSKQPRRKKRMFPGVPPSIGEARRDRQRDRRRALKDVAAFRQRAPVSPASIAR
ncbi:hypothetical protein NDU88_001443 [Pleurodeles waltl]|uniref:Uncharacterized protein n=1 Tax=Pleurodeles waltl TaxID=8319 RepID=A0AAV7U717_PLEWA|nr:hypothetical protein NDU88_001443 [Pleurodeles waltl]